MFDRIPLRLGLPIVALVLVLTFPAAARAQLTPPSVLFRGPATGPRVASILDTNLCPPDRRRGVPLVTQGIQVRLDILRSIRVVSAAQRVLEATNDLALKDVGKVRGAPRTCVGIYPDGARKNAVAIEGDTILFGHSLFRTLERKEAQDELVTLVLLHEYAHLLQSHHRINYDIGLGRQKLKIGSTRRKEMVADCAAGTLYSMMKPGLRTRPEVESIRNLFTMLGDRHSLGDHGRTCQRRAAFNHGYQRRNIANPLRPLAMTSGPILQGCLAYVDRPDVLFSKCK